MSSYKTQFNDCHDKSTLLSGGGDHLYLSKMAFINQFYSRMTGLFRLPLAWNALAQYLSALGFWNIEFEKLSLMN